jgi:hypothetical protein
LLLRIRNKENCIVLDMICPSEESERTFSQTRVVKVFCPSPKKTVRTLVRERFCRFRAKQRALEMLVSSILKALTVESNVLWVFAIQDEVRWYVSPNAPVVYDILPARIRALRSKDKGCRNAGGEWRGVGMERSGMTYPHGTPRAFRPEALSDLLGATASAFLLYFLCHY